MGIILGVTGLFYSILIKCRHIRFNYFLTVLASVLFYGLSYNADKSFWDGLFLFSLFLGLNVYLFRNIGTGIGDTLEEIEAEVEQVKNYSLLVAVGLFLGNIWSLHWFRTFSGQHSANFKGNRCF